MNHEQIARALLETVTVTEHRNDNGSTYEAKLGGADAISGASVISTSEEAAKRRMAEVVVLHVFNRITCPHCQQIVLEVDKLVGMKQPEPPSISQRGRRGG